MTTSTIIAGIDEAGRGPLAGPVVAGACIDIPLLKEHPLIRDSKKLSEEQREEAFAWIEAHCQFGFGIVDASVIDAEGILTATERAMQEALAMLMKKKKPTYLLVDGRDKFWFDIPHSSIIGGDALEPCISAASIIAKVTRDRLMQQEAKRYPLYGFGEHKGYAAPLHIDMLKAHGPCPIHRLHFLRNILTPAQLACAPTRTAPNRRRKSGVSTAARA